MAELGFHRSAKKCKEKFENVFKYHKRTKESRNGRSEGKTYRFFDQLEVFQHHPSHPTSTTPPPPAKSQNPVPTTVIVPWTGSLSVTHVTFPVTTNPTDIISQNNVIPTLNPIPTSPFSSQTMNPSQHALPSSYQNNTTHLFSSSTSSSTASDEDLERSRKRKRNWRDFFERLARDVIRKQEELQKKFLETVEKGKHERMMREEVWRMQEMERIKREHEILIQERSTAVAKDAAVVEFLQKLSGQHNSVQTRENPQPMVQAPPSPSLPPPQPPPPPLAHISSSDIQRKDNGENMTGSSSSRWPKSEVEALIRLKTTLDNKYQENAPKGPLWEEISSGMLKLGYNRSAKRCKEKWENINKYYKKVKESNKKRPEDSKTCTYFHQLDALYKEKKKTDHQGSLSSGYPDMPIGTMEP